SSGSGDDINMITALNVPCSDFMVTPDMPLPNDVSRHCSGSGTGTAAFAPDGDVVTPGCTSTSATYTATFLPKSAGSASCMVTFLGSGTTFTPQPVQLFGSGTLPALFIDVSPPVLDFGDVKVGGPPKLDHVDVSNKGSSPL